MKEEAYGVLVIDDEESIRRLLQKELAAEHREIHTAADGAAALAEMRSHWFDVILLDLRLPDVSGLDLLIQVRESVPHAEVIMITGHGDVDVAVEAMKLGAYDFIRKPFHLDRLDMLVEKAHQRVRLARENKRLRHGPESSQDSLRFIGHSKSIADIQFLIAKVAPAKIPVLITGDSGVGKDIVATAIHRGSPLAAHPMVVKNCAALQKELARSELFGHLRGAFTGADSTREGLLSFAHGSTLFLDEIGELPLEVQASLLRVLETGLFRRVGEKEERKVSIRFLFATNRRLQEEVEAGRFNEAFFHRINAFNIHIPPLRQRKEDIPLLVEYFLAKLGSDHLRYRVVPAAMDAMLHYNWPGNIRELRNVIERSIILAENGIITERCLPRELQESVDGGGALSLESVERQHILKLLQVYGGNRQQTADSLGISRKTLYRKLLQYGFE
ncbi:MAG: sigma-54 dependent transcriptional regulator [bacterium]|nr:sigma-54 dependent transcriptional regulator [bacterium]